jgi:hypothetical protein
LLLLQARLQKHRNREALESSGVIQAIAHSLSLCTAAAAAPAAGNKTAPFRGTALALPPSPNYCSEWIPSCRRGACFQRARSEVRRTDALNDEALSLLFLLLLPLSHSAAFLRRAHARADDGCGKGKDDGCGRGVLYRILC